VAASQFVLQVHTPASFALKSEAHHLYEQFRACTDPPTKIALWQESCRLADAVPVPKGALDLPYLKSQVFATRHRNEKRPLLVHDFVFLHVFLLPDRPLFSTLFSALFRYFIIQAAPEEVELYADLILSRALAAAPGALAAVWRMRMCVVCIVHGVGCVSSFSLFCLFLVSSFSLSHGGLYACCCIAGDYCLRRVRALRPPSRSFGTSSMRQS